MQPDLKPRPEVRLLNPTVRPTFSPLLGGFLILAFFSLSQSMVGLGVHYYGPLGYESGPELNLWLSYILLLFPGLFLTIDYFLKDRPEFFKPVSGALNSLAPKDWKILVALLGIYAFIMASVGNDLVLMGYPITDDEIGARFGGQILAHGHLMAPVREPLKALIHPFMFIKDGFYTSFEQPGVSAVWALGEWLGRESLFWSLVAAIPVVPIILITRRYFSKAWAVFAGVTYLFYAQAATLSITTHSHILSRSIVALALLAFETGREKGRERNLAFFSFLTALSLLCRPYEALCILFPLYIVLIFKIFKNQIEARRALPWLALGAVIPLIAFFWYNLRTTGEFFESPRMHPAYKAFSMPGSSDYEDELKKQALLTPHGLLEWLHALWRRLGANLTNNLLGVTIWFYAPLGLWVALYATRLNLLTQTLGAGVFINFLMMLAHDSYGIHSVGPINFSELSASLVILLVFGLHEVWRFIENQPGERRQTFSAAILASLLASIVFTAFNWSALHRQADVQAQVYRYVESSIEVLREQAPSLSKGHNKSLVLAQRYANYWNSDPANKILGGYVYEWKIPSPELREKTIFLRDDPALLDQELKAFPDRDVFRLKIIQTPPYMEMGWVKL